MSTTNRILLTTAQLAVLRSFTDLSIHVADSFPDIFHYGCRYYSVLITPKSVSAVDRFWEWVEENKLAELDSVQVLAKSHSVN